MLHSEFYRETVTESCSSGVAIHVSLEAADVVMQMEHW